MPLGPTVEEQLILISIVDLDLKASEVIWVSVFSAITITVWLSLLSSRDGYVLSLFNIGEASVSSTS